MLFNGVANELFYDGTSFPEFSDTKLGVGEKRDLSITFRYPSDATSDSSGNFLSFEITALAVQAKNNPEKIF